MKKAIQLIILLPLISVSYMQTCIQPQFEE